MTKRLLALLASCLLTMNLVADVGVTVNGVDASAGSGEGWSYVSPILTLSGMGPFVLHGTNMVGEVQITVNADSTVVLSNLSLLVSTSQKCSFQIAANKTVDVLLKGDNELTSGPYCAGLQVMAGANASIRLANILERGSLTAQGGSQGGAGIGGYRGKECGNIFIEGGVISAKSVDSGAGLGGGYRKAGGAIVISGGTVSAVAANGGDSIGGGAGTSLGARVTFLGGSVKAETIRNTPTNAVGQILYCVTVPELVPNAAVSITGLGDYGTKGIVADEEGKIYLWLPGETSSPTTYKFTANGVRYEATVRGVATTAVVAGQLEPTGVFVDGEDIGLAESGTGWTYSASAREISLTAMGPYVVSGTNLAANLDIVSEVGSRVKFLSFESDGLLLQGPLEIAGGTVAPTAIRGSIAITGGSVSCSSFEMAPSNGAERVWCVTVTNLTPHAAVNVDGLADYGVEGLVADAEGKIYLWLPDGDRIFTVNGVSLRAVVNGTGVVAEALPDVTPIGVTVNGIDAAYGHGAGWTYTAPTLSIIDGQRSFVLSGTNESGVVQVAVQANATVTVSNLVLASAEGSPCSIVAPYELNLVLAGTNSFTSGSSAGLNIQEGAALTIQGEMGGVGFLNAVGGGTFPGIGGEYDEAGLASITICGGSVVPVGAGSGKRKAPDIGGDALSFAYGCHPTVTILGGSVNATTIANAPVNAAGQEVFCVTVTNLVPGSVVRPAGLTGYSASGIVADAAGRIYLWLPDGDHVFTANGFRYEVTVAGDSATATLAGPATVSPSRLEVTSIEVADGVARLGLATDLEPYDFSSWLESATFEVDFRIEPTGSVVQTLVPVREGAVLFVALPSSSQGFLTVRAR